MSPNSAIPADAPQDSARVAHQLYQQLVQFLTPLLQTLDRRLDVRLVRTFLATLVAIAQWRNRNHGLLLSELGAYLLTPAQAPAGTKRLSNLLRSPKWTAELLTNWLWQQADARVQALRASGEQPLLVWDASVLEKPESIKSEGLCAVRSSKARRLKRIRKGFFNPPTGRPICVPGLHWLGLLVIGRTGAPVVAAMRWWTSRGKRASDQRTQLREMLERSRQAWGRQVRHIFDREFASGPWLQTFLAANIRVVVRWKKRQKLLDGWGEARKAWEITRGKRSWNYRYLRDSHSGGTPQSRGASGMRHTP